MMELEDVDTRGFFWSSWITLMGPECSHKKDAEDLEGLSQNEEAAWLWWQSAIGLALKNGGPGWVNDYKTQH